MNPHWAFFLTDVYRSFEPHPDHAEDLRKSGITDETRSRQRIRSIPPHMIDQMLGFPMPAVQSAYGLPFADPRGGWMDHVRMKVFPPLTDDEGHAVKYLQRKRSGVRIYFPLATLDKVLHSREPLYIVEGEKKALAVAQLGYAAVGVCGVEGWHRAGERTLHPDLDDVGLRGRVVKVIPDADVRTNPAVSLAVQRLAGALAARGATAQLVRVPEGYKGIDDWLVAEKA